MFNQIGVSSSTLRFKQKPMQVLTEDLSEMLFVIKKIEHQIKNNENGKRQSVY